MQVESAYPVIVADGIGACRDFYVRHFGFQIVFESSWFIYLAAPANPALGIAFMSPDHPSQPPGPEKFNGQGMFVTLQVADAAAEFEKMEASGARIAYPLRDEPWGQRRFGLIDPSGTWVDLVQQIEPAAGFWDPYMVVPQPRVDSEGGPGMHGDALRETERRYEVGQEPVDWAIAKQDLRERHQ